MEKRKPSSSNQHNILRYAGLGAQFLVTLGLAVYAGLKADEWLNSSPVLVCLLPLLVLFLSFYKLYRETTGKKKKNESNNA